MQDFSLFFKYVDCVLGTYLIVKKKSHFGPERVTSRDQGFARGAFRV
jgi:hypothetical protein